MLPSLQGKGNAYVDIAYYLALCGPTPARVRRLVNAGRQCV